MQIVGREMTVDEVVAEVEKDQHLLRAVGRRRHALGRRPARPSRVRRGRPRRLPGPRPPRRPSTRPGCPPTASSTGWRAKADLVLYDLKVMDDARHREIDGRPERPRSSRTSKRLGRRPDRGLGPHPARPRRQRRRRQRPAHDRASSSR
ncbi:MAG: hypothetical protein MZV63_65555 [Marinilabiliales bacterium]|nr:hypothetical protein [Marinilabiliales bacterium]